MQAQRQKQWLHLLHLYCWWEQASVSVLEVLLSWNAGIVQAVIPKIHCISNKFRPFQAIPAACVVLFSVCPNKCDFAVLEVSWGWCQTSPALMNTPRSFFFLTTRSLFPYYWAFFVFLPHTLPVLSLPILGGIVEDLSGCSRPCSGSEPLPFTSSTASPAQAALCHNFNISQLLGRCWPLPAELSLSKRVDFGLFLEQERKNFFTSFPL